jgi:hypothetical protein
MKAYNEIIDFMAAGFQPEDIIAFKPSSKVQKRIAYLISKEKTSSLTTEEANELEQYSQLEHLMRMAKAKAHAFVGK